MFAGADGVGQLGQPVGQALGAGVLQGLQGGRPAAGVRVVPAVRAPPPAAAARPGRRAAPTRRDPGPAGTASRRRGSRGSGGRRARRGPRPPGDGPGTAARTGPAASGRAPTSASRSSRRTPGAARGACPASASDCMTWAIWLGYSWSVHSRARRTKGARVSASDAGAAAAAGRGARAAAAARARNNRIERMFTTSSASDNGKVTPQDQAGSRATATPEDRGSPAAVIDRQRRLVIAGMSGS